MLKNTKFEQVAREAPVYSLDALVADFGGTLRWFLLFYSPRFHFTCLISLFWKLCLSLLSFFQSLPWVQFHDSLAPLVGCLATVSSVSRKDF